MRANITRLFMLLLLAAPVMAFAQQSLTAKTEKSSKIEWLTVEQAQAKAKADPKPVFVDVFTSWCGPCKMMMAKTFTDPGIIKYVNDHFYAVKFNAEGPDAVNFKEQKFENPQYDPARTRGRNGTHQLTYAIANVNGRVAYPTIVYMDAEMNVLSPVQGYLTPEQIEPILVFFGEGHYKEKEFAAFRTEFKSLRAPVKAN